MGWLWKDNIPDSSSSPYPLSRGNHPWRPSDDDDGGGRCSTRKVVESNCRTEEVEPGRFIRKCEKKEQILRECVGRPVEVLQSNTEHTEEDVTDEVTRSNSSAFGSRMEPFSFPGLRSDIEAIERGLMGGFDDFLQAAEEMKNELTRAFGIPPDYRQSTPFPRQVPLEEPSMRRDGPKQGNDPTLDEYAGQIREV